MWRLFLPLHSFPFMFICFYCVSCLEYSDLSFYILLGFIELWYSQESSLPTSFGWSTVALVIWAVFGAKSQSTLCCYSTCHISQMKFACLFIQQTSSVNRPCCPRWWTGKWFTHCPLGEGVTTHKQVVLCPLTAHQACSLHCRSGVQSLIQACRIDIL